MAQSTTWSIDAKQRTSSCNAERSLWTKLFGMVDIVSLLRDGVSLVRRLYDLRENIRRDDSVGDSFFSEVLDVMGLLEQIQRLELSYSEESRIQQVEQTLIDMNNIVSDRIRNYDTNLGSIANSSASYFGQFSVRFTELRNQLDRHLDFLLREVSVRSAAVNENSAVGIERAVQNSEAILEVGRNTAVAINTLREVSVRSAAVNENSAVGIERAAQNSEAILEVVLNMAARQAAAINDLSYLMRQYQTQAYDAMNVPNLYVTVPVVRYCNPSGDPSNWFFDEYSLYFVCSHTHEVVPCGPKNKGYRFTDKANICKGFDVIGTVFSATVMSIIPVFQLRMLYSMYSLDRDKATTPETPEPINNRNLDWIEKLLDKQDRHREHLGVEKVNHNGRVVWVRKGAKVDCDVSPEDRAKILSESYQRALKENRKSLIGRVKEISE